MKIESFHPDTVNGKRVYLGYIQFQYDEKTQDGVIHMSNFHSRLWLRHLSFGGTSKDKDKSQTGQHGEGLKMAVNVFRRHPHNHTVRIEASGFSWSFGYNTQLKLCCTLTRIRPERILQERVVARGLRHNTETSYVGEDVTVIIGEPKVARAGSGEKAKSNKVNLQDFEKWLKEELLDVNSPQSVRTAVPYR